MEIYEPQLNPFPINPNKAINFKIEINNLLMTSRAFSLKFYSFLRGSRVDVVSEVSDSFSRPAVVDEKEKKSLD